MRRGSFPVSYTHLDVYKRQALKKVRVYYGLIGSFIAGAVLSGLLTPLFTGRTILAALVPLLAAFLIMLCGEKSA